MSWRLKRTEHLIVLAGSLAVAFVTTARADILHVPGDYPTIQAAIDAAMDGDEVEVHPGTYNETINFLGKAIRVYSTDGPDVTIIDAQQTGTVVTCDSAEGPDSVLEAFTITGGNAGLGGGMYNVGGSPTVTNCTFSGNMASDAGGGMYNAGGSPTVTNCTFDRHWAGDGGGMFNWGSSPTVTNCTFTWNFGLTGGGMLNIKSDPTVTNCTFNGNTAAAGGGMYNVGGSPTVTNCTFSGNEGLIAGGGMGNIVSSPTVTNCTFDRNLAAEGGGGMANSDSSPTVTNCTFSENSTKDFGTGGGMSNGGGSPTVTNCILWGDSPDEISGPATVSYSDVAGGFAGLGNIDADPLFVAPGSGDYRLSPGSPCIDAADNTAVPKGITTDLDGNPRFVDDPDTEDTGNPGPPGPIVDMGAYEFQVTNCPWDVNGDGVVNHHDILEVVHNLGRCDDPDNCPWDVNGDGIVNGRDVAAVARHFGPCPKE